MTIASMTDAEEYMRATALSVLKELCPDENVQILFSDRDTIHTPASCVVSRISLNGKALCEMCVLVFFRPHIKRYIDMGDESVLRLIATEEAVHVKHRDHGPGYAAEMSRHGLVGNGHSTPPPQSSFPPFARAARLALSIVPPMFRLTRWYDRRIIDAETEPIVTPWRVTEKAKIMARLETDKQGVNK